MKEKPILGVIGGSGLYQFEGLHHIETHDIDTPFGSPSSPIVIGSLNNVRVAFIARHGIGHFISPSEVNYRANIYALKSLGCQYVLSISACGSLREDFSPGHFVVPDQLVDFTRGTRKPSFFGEGMAVHVSTATPFCPGFSAAVMEALHRSGAITHKGGKLITIEGPRFSTRGESNLFRAWGMDIIGMTTSPEAFLAREAEMCYAVLAHVTDYDVWHISEEPVSVDMVIRTLSQNTHTAQEVVKFLVEELPLEPICECEQALSSAIMTRPECIPPETRNKLSLLVDKYLKE